MEVEAIKQCTICRKTVKERHPYDHNACVPCGEKYFKSIKPALTLDMEGLTPKQKSEVIRECIKDHMHKENMYRAFTQDAKASCYRGYLEHTAVKKGFS